MGYASIAKKSRAQLTKHIRSLAKDSEKVAFTKHASTQMQRRQVSLPEVLECLRNGSIERAPEPNLAKGSLECRMERYVAGCECKVVVALCDEDPDLVVVTVML